MPNHALQPTAGAPGFACVEAQSPPPRLSWVVRRLEGVALADIDPLLMSAEVDLTALLAVQVVLAVVAVVAGFAGGRRWARPAFPVALVLVAAACGGTLYRCADAQESVRSRLEGLLPGPHLPAERAENHLDWVAGRGRLGIGIAAAAWSVGGLLYYSARRSRTA